jgi:serine/threonine-protein kinase
MSRLKRLIHEIHRRSLWQVLLIYIGAAWACFELIDAVTERLGLPAWLPGLAIVLFLLGLPFVVATALVREESPALAIRPEATEAGGERAGVEAAAARREATRRHRFLTWRNAGLSFLVALAVWGVIATGWMLFGERATPEEVDARKSIAVLPLENLSREEATAPFTDGIHDDILTHLYKIGDLKVISRTSVLEYRDTRKNLREIADELGVATILEGGVQRAGNRVRINVQLIDAETDEHLWAETYEEDLTAENVFAIQTDIAQRIASALKAQLTPEETERIAARPTDNLAAYEHYVRGKAYSRRGRAEPQGLERLALLYSAIAEYELAVELDPDFSDAWAEVASIRNQIFFEQHELLEFPAREREKGEQALARAVVLAPESFETHSAQARYYVTVGEDPARAMRHLKVAETLRPNDAEVLRGMGAVLAFQGNREEALTCYERAVELDPQNAAPVRSVAYTYLTMRRFAEAERYLDRAIALDPSAGRSYDGKFYLYLWGLGDTAKARVFAEQHPDRRGWQASLYYVRRDYEQALADYPSHYIDAWPGMLHPLHLTGQAERAQAYADSMAREWQQFGTYSESLTAVQVSEWHSYLGLAYAFAGDIEAAIRTGQEALELYPVASDQFNYWIIVRNVCDIYILAGEHEAAIDQLEVLLSTPTLITTARLRLDPFYDPLRSHPRFQALLERYD